MARGQKNAGKQVRVRMASDELSAVIHCPDCGAPFKYRRQVRHYRRQDGVSDYPREIYFHGSTQGECPNKTRTIYKSLLAPIMRALYDQSFSDAESVEQWKKLKLRELKNKHTADIATAAVAKAKLPEIQKAKERLLDSIEKGGVPPEWISERVEKLRKDEEAIKTALADASKTYKEQAKRIKDTFTLMFDANMEFDSAAPNEKRLLYKNLLKTATLKNGILRLVWVNDAKYKINVKKPPKSVSESIGFQKQLDDHGEDWKRQIQSVAYWRRKAKRAQEGAG